MLHFLSILLRLPQCSLKTVFHSIAEQSVRTVVWCLFWLTWWNIALSTAKDKHWGFSRTLCFVVKHVAVWGSASSTPRRKFEGSLCCASITVYYFCSAESLIVYCYVVAFNNVRVICGLKCRKQEGLAFSLCVTPLDREQLWKESVLLVLFKASLSVWLCLANSDGLPPELSWQVFL